MKLTTLIRNAQSTDIAQVIGLMKALAEFEGYDSEFNVTCDDLLELGLKKQVFFILVAEQHADIVGMLVYYWVPFTYDRKPWMQIKELYVQEAARKQGVGALLFNRARDICEEARASRMRWDVLKTNVKAQSFYKSLGAQMDNQWLPFVYTI